MKNILKYIAPALLAVAVGSANAATIAWDFTDGDATDDTNDFGAGVTVSAFTGAGNGATSEIAPVTRPVSQTDNKFKIGAHKESAHMEFTVTIDAFTTIDLKNIAFEQGLDFNGASMSPLLGLTITVGGVAQPEIRFDNIGSQNVAGSYFSNESQALSGLTGLTDTTVVFDFDFVQQDRQNSIAQIANTMDNIVLSSIPEPSSAALLLGLSGLALILRRRK